MTRMGRRLPVRQAHGKLADRTRLADSLRRISGTSLVVFPPEADPLSAGISAISSATYSPAAEARDSRRLADATSPLILKYHLKLRFSAPRVQSSSRRFLHVFSVAVQAQNPAPSSRPARPATVAARYMRRAIQSSVNSPRCAPAPPATAPARYRGRSARSARAMASIAN